MPEEFPQHPFWSWSLAVYARPGVTDACLTLQDEYGLDVNLVLFCIWAGVAGPGGLTESELGEAAARGRQWQTEVVERIRWVRRTLKEDSLGATAELVGVFRPRVQSLEIEAEHVEQLLLAGLVPEQRGARGPGAVDTNLQMYFERAGIAPGSAAHELAGLIVARALQPGEKA
jgi:uncharacterized protein (TIGR02444 family)